MSQQGRLRPRYIPPPLNKPENYYSNFYGSPEGYYGTQGSYSTMFNSSGPGGRSNVFSPTYFGLTEVLATHMPSDSTVVFMEPKSKRAWMSKNAIRTFMTFFFLFTVGVAGFFLIRDRYYSSSLLLEAKPLTPQHSPKPRVHDIPQTNEPVEEMRIPGKPILNKHADNKKIYVENMHQAENKLKQPEFQQEFQKPSRPIRIVHSFDEDDGEVIVETQG